MVGSDPSGTSHWASWETKKCWHSHSHLHISHLSHELCFPTPECPPIQFQSAESNSTFSIPQIFSTPTDFSPTVIHNSLRTLSHPHVKNPLQQDFSGVWPIFPQKKTFMCNNISTHLRIQQSSRLIIISHSSWYTHLIYIHPCSNPPDHANCIQQKQKMVT
jgi:hypothetical protein